ncbi:MAG: hypothetical protein ABI895_34455 [Deltaproteobacteria bacterium]
MTSEERRLKNLSERDVAPQRAEQIRRRAHAILREREQALRHPIAVGWSRYYHRLIEPGMLIALGLTYLVWTVQDTMALFH